MCLSLSLSILFFPVVGSAVVALTVVNVVVVVAEEALRRDMPQWHARGRGHLEAQVAQRARHRQRVVANVHVPTVHDPCRTPATRTGLDCGVAMDERLDLGHDAGSR